MTANTILRPTLGPKEGRLPPGLFSPVLGGSRRRFSNRQRHVFIFGVVLLVFIIYFFSQREILARFEELGDTSNRSPLMRELKSPISSEDTNEDGAWRSRLSSPKSIHTVDTQIPITEDVVDGKERLEEPLTKEPITENTEQKSATRQKPKSQFKSQKPPTNHWPERPNLKSDLEAVFALQPDEVNMRELLRPIENGGPERMRELGLRTRAYAKYLSAWERLHLVEDPSTGETSIRDDLIQYLRNKQTDDDTSLGVSLTNTIHNYEAYRGFLTKLARILFPWTSPYFADHLSLRAQFKSAGRGIVLTAGDDQAKYLLTTIYSFRELGCDLPIEIMYLGEEDLDEDHRFELESLPGVTTRDISQMVDDEGWKLAGWAIKPFAILLSSFREVIFIDADSFFFRDPATLFDDPDYKKTGALFFRDRTIMPESKRKWLMQILPRPIHKLAKESTWWTGTSGHHQESGVVVVDKWRHFVSMLLICRFNGSDRDPRDGKMGVYEMMHGDKETFWIGFLLAGDPSFAFHKGAVGSIGVIEAPPPNVTKTETTDPDSDELLPAPKARHLKARSHFDDEEEEEEEDPDNFKICSPQLLHLDVDNTPLWFNGWLLVSKYADRSKRRFAPMESYLSEPRNYLADEDFWELTTDNMCCLTSDAESRWDLSEHDLGLIKMMRDRALEVGIMK
ncbi:glycosyltransferase family 71 protein [Xylaria arbuscula]|nr:glycosyltransferase family 71 protein [Xylaria arbuscula]